MIAAAVMACLGVSVPAGAASAGAAWAANGRAASGSWHKAIELRGPAGFIDPYIESVSCGSPGNCAAGGAYGDRINHIQAFVVAERAGRWGRAVEVPGTAALNTGGFAQVTSVSCPSPATCTAYGTLSIHLTDPGKLFVVSEIAGRWHRAVAFPAEGDFLATDPLSCPSAGNCVAGGSIRLNGGRRRHAVVVTQAHGRWGPPVRLSGAGLRGSDIAEVDAVSCSSAGNCTASGTERSSTFDGMFAVSEQAGQWGQAVQIPLSPGLTAIYANANTIYAMSCASAGNCAITGTYEYYVGGVFAGYRPFVVSETGGQWGQEQDVPGLIKLSDEGGTSDSVSCAPPDTCTAGGYYPDSTGQRHAFLVTQTGGLWGHVLRVAAALHGGDPVEITSVSCTATGTCTAGGSYDTTNSGQAFVIAETGGRWGHPRPLPGLATLNIGRGAGVNAISCSTTGHCTAVGYYYYVRARKNRAFAATQT